jgi:hypothetical protein
MRILNNQFEGRGSQKGWSFTLVTRNDKYAIYEKRSESNVYYEVIMVKFQKARVAKYPDGRVVEYPDMELYPGDEDFGVYGWSYGSLDEASKNFTLLVYNVPDIMMSPEILD